MKNNEIAQLLIESNKTLFGKMPEKKVQRIVKEVIKTLATQVDEMDEGKILLPGFGVFRKKTIEKEGVKEDRIIFIRRKGKTD